MYSINKHKRTKTTNIKQNRFLSIAKLSTPIFHIDDLARLWGVTNRNTLSTSLRRYVKNGLIYRLYRGLYSIKPLTELDPLLLGAQAINDYCYLSGETVLVKHGVIFQQLSYLTFIGTKTKRFKIGNQRYYCRQLKDKFLYDNSGINQIGQINVASLERAVADILYFDPKYYFDNPGPINWKKVAQIKAAVYGQ
jgi:predicted transcriptional regulator of viral defense system